jgi:flagellar assembly factor FliW
LTLIGTRFGNIEFDVLDTITFADGLIGFPGATEYIVLNSREGSPFRWLQCTQEPGLAFLVTDPANYVATYAPPVNDLTLQSLNLTVGTPRLVFVTVNIPRGRPQDMTINLAGPLLINAEERIGRQIVLEDGAYTTRHRVFEKAGRVMENVAA